ncbi:MAG: biotin/lipoyl-binding protein [Eggerthellales bacterium]|nr:biotin/lipoyl-binding protein [Eggerthellales bacterium]
MKEFKFTIDGKQYNAAVNELEDNFAEVTLNGKTYKVELEKEEAPAAAAVRRPAAAAASAAAVPAGLMTVKSPLPGSIVKVLVKAGQAVKKGDVLLTMESMKMENNVTAEADGTVKAIYVEPGKNVMQDDKLLDLETAAAAAAPAAAPAPKTAPTPKADAPKPAAPKAADVPAGGYKVTSPLPGSIIKVLVTEGQDVKKGDTLLTLESMKMENAVMADRDGKVTKIAVTAGQNVMQEDLLMILG